jgi:hypothetical protein
MFLEHLSSLIFDLPDQDESMTEINATKLLIQKTLSTRSGIKRKFDCERRNNRERKKGKTLHALGIEPESPA